jgi:hypothetical protein
MEGVPIRSSIFSGAEAPFEDHWRKRFHKEGEVAAREVG